MNSEFQADVLAIWQEQARDEQLIRTEDVRARAEHMNTQNRRWRLTLTPLFALIVMWEAWQVWTGTELVERAGDLLTITALMYVVFRFRKYRAEVSPVALGRTNSIEFYRAALVRQRDLSRDNWGYVLPFVPGVALSLLGGIGQRTPTEAILLVASGIALFAGVTWWNARTVRQLQTEIDLLTQ